MGLNSSGPISLAGTTTGQSIEIENGGNGTTQISLNDTAVRTLAGVTTPGSTIIMPTNFYGKSNAFTLTITSNTSNANLATLATSAGWNGTSLLNATINSSVVLSASSTGNYGLTVNGSFPAGVNLTNNGYILGMGGNGGDSHRFLGLPGGSGGTAMLISSAITVDNASGVIGGGGGGGGSGNFTFGSCGGPCYAGGGGGGGRTGSTNSSGGTGDPAPSYGNRPGSPGTFNGAGGGGTALGYGAPGGPGGTWGASGCPGTAGYSYGSAAPGGSGGAATSGASNITWTNVGTRYGTVG